MCGGWEPGRESFIYGENSRYDMLRECVFGLDRVSRVWKHEEKVGRDIFRV